METWGTKTERTQNQTTIHMAHKSRRPKSLTASDSYCSLILLVLIVCAE